MAADPSREKPGSSPSTSAAVKAQAAKPMKAADIAKGALRRLALSKREPTPDNYAQAWAEEAGTASDAASGVNTNTRAKAVYERLAMRLFDEPGLRDELVNALLNADWEQARQLSERAADHQNALAQAWSHTVERLARALERGSRQWTAARKKDSLQRVLEGNRSDLSRLQQRLKQLIASWEGDATEDPAAANTVAVDEEVAATAAAVPAASDLHPNNLLAVAAWDVWLPLLQYYDGALRSALPVGDERGDAIALELRGLLIELEREGATAILLQQVEQVCARARRLLAHRHHLVDELHRLTQEMSEGLCDLVEDDSWVRGQSESLRQSLGILPSVRSVRAASDMLAHTRARQRELRGERDHARLALKDAIQRMLTELDELGDHTGRFGDSVARYVDTIAGADSLESLAGVVRQMVEESRAVHGLVAHTQEKLRDGRDRAAELEARVRSLEEELRRLSDEVSTDVLTEVANRRGLMQAFEAETSRIERQGGELAIGLLDIDNFKKLNDSLGHNVGDQALKNLAAHVAQQLRPIDIVARFGGEEFVVLLPETAVAQAQQTLTRLQRMLSSSLFMHNGREVFVTFSAGVTTWRVGEPIEIALERADEALYEAKRTGKNRTCIG